MLDDRGRHRDDTRRTALLSLVTRRSALLSITNVDERCYTVGGLHVVSLSGEKGRLGGNETAEMAWLMADLEAASEAKGRGEISWIITHVHTQKSPVGIAHR
jgi:hypothetical protein